MNFYAGHFAFMVIKSGHTYCGRGIMAARQLPKLKTRVRFPSPAPKINRRNRRFCFWIVGDGIEPDKAASAAQGSERSGVGSPHAVKGARRNHQEPRDWIDFGRELYIPFARTTLRLGEASGGCATRQTSRTGERVPHEVLTKCG